jgi:predicted dehydrogenase
MRIGVIGAAGKIGQMRVRTVLDNPATKLVAVMDLAKDKAAAEAPGVPAFDRIEEFLAVPMDAVIISTPAHVREGLCLKAFEAGLDVLTEKPLSNTVEGARRIVEAAKAHGRMLGAGFNMRYYPAFAHVKDVMESGVLGEIDHVRIYGGHSGLSNFTHDWEYKAEFSGGGALWDVGIHMTDMARFLLGEITSVYGVATNRVWKVEGSEDNAVAVFKSAEGIPAIYHATWNDWKGYKSAVEVYGSKGMVRGQYAPMQTVELLMDAPGGKVRKARNLYPGIALREKLKSWKTTAVASFADELADFLKLVAGRPTRIADGHAGLRAVEIAAAVPESTRTGAPVALADLGPMVRAGKAERKPDPLVSIVVTIVEGGAYVRDFLQSIADFEDPPPLDVIVPYDASVADVAAYAAEFPFVRFMDLGTITPIRPITSEAGKHELYDRRRSAGLAAAKGDIIGILEDRGRPAKNWARVLVSLYEETGRNVIGGAIECQEPASPINFAFWTTDFGRYGRPFRSGPADWVSDVNLSYSRKALEETRHLWKERYHEPIVHWHLIGKGEELWLSDELVVNHVRPKETLKRLLPERFQWGRLFGEIRVRDMPDGKRFALIAASPIIPPMLWLRHFRLQASKGRGMRYLKALPYVMILSTAWTLGEVWGYITKRN